jgi:hypothetical protein
VDSKAQAKALGEYFKVSSSLFRFEFLGFLLMDFLPES